MKLKKLIITFLLSIPNVLSAQQFLSAESNWFDNCKCTEIEVKVGGNITARYMNDTLNNRITFQTLNPNGKSIDTLLYNEKGNITAHKRYTVYDTMSLGGLIATYSYSEKGQLLIKDEGSFVYTYQWDEKGRPVKYTRTFDGEDEEIITLKYPNDTTALLEYRDNGVVIATGKRILNKRNQIVSEVLKNPAKGTEVHYVFKYDKAGRLLYMQKTKVIKDEVRFFGSPHYEYQMLGDRRKIEFTYDSSGRMISQKVYQGLSLELMMSFELIYK